MSRKTRDAKVQTNEPKPSTTLDDIRMLNEKEAAALMGLSPVTLRIWRCQGRGPTWYKMGKLALYRPADIADWQRKVCVPQVPAEL